MIGWLVAVAALAAFAHERGRHRGLLLGRDLALERARDEAARLAHRWTLDGLASGDERAVLLGEGAAKVRDRLSAVIDEVGEGRATT